MVDVTLIDTSGLSRTLQVPEGQSLMQAAVSAGVRGIVGECGGSAMCATCHVYVDEAFADRLPAPLETELEMLECTASERLPNSRLGCQIKLSAALDGLVVRLPERQQ
ncbi:2Fe-2S iron-sulfur cluster-binding protein [Hydrogenophaga sp.]|uniref:2Fe-2S iron-sulfur cluster-binding protein n=1 Tax=Hydrogenophaga sp. TaxID=1904254 RepID=UPI0025BE730D|nr:2Fe-2S iron-sulfur cluster-binding protein [Hydrogenophaga sp.]MBT9464777.1 2Fe-2S iron-sulfur cluster binding domain-containing protein [Hydrogenophaga sp.]